MLTKESINLRKYIYPKVDVQKSNELHKLYIFLKSIKRIPLKINYYHQIDQKTITIKKGKFIPTTISQKTYQLKLVETNITIKNTNILIKIYSNENINNMINHIYSAIQYVYSIYPTNIRSIKINLYLLKNKKLFVKGNPNFTKNEINSGFCINNLFDSEITIYRKEELIKVLIHELFHAFEYDYRNDTDDIINHYQERYMITSEKINTFEAYTEIWANIINCFLISEHANRHNESLFYTLIHLEKSFCELQKDKVFYKTLLDTKKIDINRNTNVLSYFIIRCELYNRLNEFIKFCRLHNQNYVKMTQENKWFQFIKKNKKIIKNNRRFNRLQKNNPVYKTMKMSINEININYGQKHHPYLDNEPSYTSED